MNDAELGGVVRALRHRRGWRQGDLAARAAVSASMVGLLERGHADTLCLRGLRRIVTALDLRLGWDAGYRGAELARLRDADHSELAELLTGRLQGFGWIAEPEVSFNHYGDRGRIDLLALHPSTSTLLVIEIKTVIADIQGLLGGLNTKRRVAPGVARSLGWRPTRTVPLLVVTDSTTTRRRLGAHPRLFAGLPLRGRAAVTWLRRPDTAPAGLLLLVKLPDRKGTSVRRAARQRVRRTEPPTSVQRAGQPARQPPEGA